MLNMFIAVGSFGIIIPIIPAYLKEIGQGGTAAGLIIAIFAFAQFLVSPIGGNGRISMVVARSLISDYLR